MNQAAVFTTQEQICEETQRLIRILANGTLPSTFPPTSVGIFKRALTLSGFPFEFDTDKFDTNGWDYDYWQPCVINGHPYTLSGSGYYGGFSVSHATPEDDDDE